jgi:FKBP-type peptidyl-prolyl cis-trans isomerase FkpA
MASSAAVVQAADPALETEDQKTVYALGLALSRNLGPFALEGDELDILVVGIRDGVLARDPKVDLQVYGPKIQQMAQARQAKVAEAEKVEAAKFLEAEAAKPGAEKTESGLIIIMEEEGTGASPAATDKVKVHYHGTLRDGTVFDSSVDRGQPATFGLNRVISCWTEGVQKLKVGGKARLVCPSAIAYGDRGSPPKIKPGAALAFEVELLEIVQE